MIIRHQNNVAAFAGNYISLPSLQGIAAQQISITTAAAANDEIEQARSIMRFVFSRLFSRVN